ncbi:MAG: DUF4493 domain-containing protein [Muribaculaceae bacterium]|nr:DUF4493 domain-containing protein [Muribaculaceae bacterium]
MKLTKKGCSLAALASVLMLGGCASEAPWGSGSDDAGRITLKLTADGAVKKSTRANDEVSSVIPGTHEFAISLNSKDGSYSKTWSSPESFNSEAGFPMGNYTLTAAYGDIETEGFSSPCFVGETDVNVRVGEETFSTVTATLANSMVSVRYTDAFRAMFPQFHALLASDGHVSPIVVMKEEGRPAYMSPRNITLSISLTNQQGKEQTVVPATFTAQPQHHYIITVGVKEQVGVPTLDVAFEENVVQERTEILLTDELFTAPLPEITVNDDASSPLSAFESIPLTDKNPEIHLVAFGGIQKSTINLEPSEGGEALFTSMDLVNANANTEAMLDSWGLKCYGFTAKEENSKSKMAVVNLKDFSQSLKPGKYKIWLKVTDAFGREIAAENLPIVELSVSAVSIDVKVGEPKFLSDSVEVEVSSNYPTAGEQVEFTINGVNAVASRTKIEGEGTTNNWKLVLKNPNGIFIEKEYRVVGKFFNRQLADVAVKFPEISCDVDAFSSKALVRVNCTDAEARKYLVENLKISGIDIAEENVSRDTETSIITLSSLAQKTNYKNCRVGLENSNKSFAIPFQTETILGVPNGDFEELSTTINSTIQQGGRWTTTNTVFSPYFTTTLSMIVKEPVGWSSTNGLTFNLNANNLNTWYVVPSVYNTTVSWISHQPEAKAMGIGQDAYDSTAEIYTKYSSQSGANAMVIRNVAWDTSGSNIADTKQTGNTSFSNYYGSEKPSSIANRTAGKMWLGNSSQEGVSFASRPAKLKGYYQFIADDQASDEKGVVEIQVLSGSKVIAQGKKELEKCESYALFEVPLNYVALSELFQKKATSLRISFTSSNTSDIKTTDYCNKDECISRGSMLVVDNLTFEY